ncbi:hypothetical protein R3P38DRAFT_3487013, partial [Favolaschia claudopus]
HGRPASPKPLRRRRSLSSVAAAPPVSAAPPPPPPASALPPAVKRQYDDIVEGIGPGSNAAKKRKRTQYRSMSAFQKLVALSKFYHRGVNPFFDIGLVMTFGGEAEWGAPSDSNSPAKTKDELRLIAAFKTLFARAPELLPALKQIYLEIIVNADQWDRLTSMMREAATSARTTDTNGLKHKLNYFLPHPLKHVLSPPVPEEESKSNRGLAHPMLRYYIIGCKDRLRLPPLEYTSTPKTSATPDGDQPDADVPSSPSPPNEWKIVAGNYQLTYKPYPSFIYEEGKFDPKDLDTGLLRSDVVLRCLRHIWLGPGTALSGVDKISATCNASLLNVKTVTPEMICYAVAQMRIYHFMLTLAHHSQARTVLGTSEWTKREENTISADFFILFSNFLLLNPSIRGLWKCWNGTKGASFRIFTNIDIDSESDQAEDSDDEDDVLAQRRRRAAPASPS